MPRPDRIMENEKNHNHNGSGNGFLLGVIVGVLITLLFTTKRGRAIFKDVMERGVQKFADLEQLMKETGEEFEDEFEEEAGDDYIPSEPVEEPASPKVHKPVQSKPAEEPEKPQPKSLTPAKPVEEKPKFLEVESPDDFVVEATEAEDEPIKKTSKADTEEEEKPKTTRVKRLFRGLRKKS